MADILVVEDVQPLRELMASQLKSAGYDVETAENGVQGLAVLEEKVPDLIMLDLLMPLMNGYDFLIKIRADARYKKLPCIVFSNSGQPDDLNRAYQCGADAVFIKADFNPDQLVQKVQDLLAQDRDPAAPAPESPQNS